MSFSPTGSDWSLRSSAGFTKALSNSAACHSSPDSALRASVLECGASAPLSPIRAAAPRPDAKRRHPAARVCQSSRGLEHSRTLAREFISRMS
jgi:hypothetical protein